MIKFSRLNALLLSLALAANIVLPLYRVQASSTNLIANPSVETINPNNGNLPQNWSKNRWGTNKATFKYNAEGYSSNRSLNVQLKSFSSGDAKWVHKHTSVAAGKIYVFSNFYKSDVVTEVVAETKSKTNQLTYQPLGSLPAASQWTQSTFEYTAPADAKSVSILHLINRVGSLSTDAYSLTLKDTPSVLPTINITHPASGTKLSGNTTLDASASHPSGIVGVQFKLDGNNVGTEDTTAPYSLAWDSKTVTNGPHSIQAVARTPESLTNTAQVSIEVNNVSDPGPTSLVPNYSLETVDSNDSQRPKDWQSGSWGTNSTQFSYVNEGRTGSKSVRTEVGTYTDGDAKWYFNPVSSQAGHTYTYSDYYKSNVPTRAVAVSYDSANTPTYIDFGANIPATANWTQFSAQFSAPANSTRITVFHLIDRAGWLIQDDVSLTDNGAPVPDTGTIPNSSLENIAVGNSSMPDKWSHGSWGTNTPTFEYLNEGHTGNKSVKVSVSNYVSGDAKWIFNPISLERGKQYRFSTWYKTNTFPRVVAEFTKDDNSVQYFGLPNPEPNGSSNWQYYSDSFSVPQNAKSVTVFLFISNNGWVQTDDYGITPYQPVGFSRPLVTLTFDDGHEDNIGNALPLLNSYGFKTTQCYSTQHVEGNQTAINGVLAFKNSGHEICSHTVSHPFLTSLNTSQLTQELSHSKTFLESITGTTVKDFASPYGDYNQTVNNEIKKYYRSHRTVDEGYNSKDNFNIYKLRVQNLQSNTTLAEVQSWIAQAQATNTWLILVYHRIANDPGQFDTKTSDFAQQLQAIASSGITVKTYNDALDEVTAQL